MLGGIGDIIILVVLAWIFIGWLTRNTDSTDDSSGEDQDSYNDRDDYIY